MLILPGKSYLSGISILLLLPSLVFAHPGGLDADGGHHVRKTGEYHHHQKQIATATPSALPSPFKISPKEREQRINKYFRTANENVGALSCDQIIHERDVAASVKTIIRQRDGNRCVICGSTHKLEVDHKRALMNGGDNSPPKSGYPL